eukprot:599201-Pyramimonas_sp.AAC.2
MAGAASGEEMYPAPASGRGGGGVYPVMRWLDKVFTVHSIVLGRAAALVGCEALGGWVDVRRSDYRPAARALGPAAVHNR